MGEELRIQNEIRIALGRLGIPTFRMNTGVFKTQDGRTIKQGIPGTSDLLAIKNGQAIWLEVKTKRGRASDAQISFIEEMKKNGCRAGLVRSVGDALELCGLLED